MEFVIYAATFRLSIIAAGVFCVYMGYRLFMNMPVALDVEQNAEPLEMTPDGNSSTTITGKMDKFSFKVKNAAPGTCFAFFGALIISIMLWQGNPELRVVLDKGDGEKIEYSFRKGQNTYYELVKSGNSFENQGNLKRAIEKYAEALLDPNLPLGQATDAFFGIASVYQKEERFEEAITYARLVLNINPDHGKAKKIIDIAERNIIK